MSHLETIGETYSAHFMNAISFSYTSLQISGILLIHAIFPDFYVTDGSRMLNGLVQQINRMVVTNETQNHHSCRCIEKDENKNKEKK